MDTSVADCATVFFAIGSSLKMLELDFCGFEGEAICILSVCSYSFDPSLWEFLQHKRETEDGGG